jgi:hypothetical protein
MKPQTRSHYAAVVQIYLNDPRGTPRAELRTELYIPLESTHGQE